MVYGKNIMIPHVYDSRITVVDGFPTLSCTHEERGLAAPFSLFSSYQKKEPPMPNTPDPNSDYEIVIAPNTSPTQLTMPWPSEVHVLHGTTTWASRFPLTCFRFNRICAYSTLAALQDVKASGPSAVLLDAVWKDCLRLLVMQRSSLENRKNHPPTFEQLQSIPVHPVLYRRVLSIFNAVNLLDEYFGFPHNTSKLADPMLIDLASVVFWDASGTTQLTVPPISGDSPVAEQVQQTLARLKLFESYLEATEVGFSALKELR